MRTASRSPSRRERVAVVALTVLACLPVATNASLLPVATRPDLTYTKTTDGALRLDLYRLKGHSGLPVVMLIHGGSWRRGDKTDWGAAAKAFARAGFLVVAPNYRLSPPGGATIFPGHVDDLRTALRWTRSNAKRYGGDPRRVAMVGTSAGAHLSLLVASTGRTRPDAVALYSPPVDMARLHGAGIATESIEVFLGCTPELCPEVYARASGLFQVDEATPPVLLAYSDEEVLPAEQGRMLRQRLREIGIRHRSYELDGTAHGLAAGRQVFDETVTFLKRELTGRL